MDLWPDLSELQEVKGPQEILEEQGLWLSKKTKDKVYGLCVKKDLSKMDGLTRRATYGNIEFIYDFYICGRGRENYKYQVLSVGTRLEMYPCKIYLNKELAMELRISEKISIKGMRELKEILKSIFHTDRIVNVVAAVMGMSK